MRLSERPRKLVRMFKTTNRDTNIDMEQMDRHDSSSSKTNLTYESYFELPSDLLNWNV